MTHGTVYSILPRHN